MGAAEVVALQGEEEDGVLVENRWETWHDPLTNTHVQFIPEPVMQVQYEVLVHLLELAGFQREEKVTGE